MYNQYLFPLAPLGPKWRKLFYTVCARANKGWQTTLRKFRVCAIWGKMCPSDKCTHNYFHSYRYTCYSVTPQSYSVCKQFVIWSQGACDASLIWTRTYDMFIFNPQTHYIFKEKLQSSNITSRMLHTKRKINYAKIEIWLDHFLMSCPFLLINLVSVPSADN
jgi:hypothetical protein